jgi:hypothetical protein
LERFDWHVYDVPIVVNKPEPIEVNKRKGELDSLSTGVFVSE